MSTLPAAERALGIIDAVAQLGTPDVTRQLTTILTRPMVALVAGVSATRVVRTWEENGNVSEPRDKALRVALQASLILKTRFSDGVVRNWFVGHNSTLDDQSPGELVRSLTKLPPLSSDSGETARRILAAARAFVTQ
jgi:hypothetical protein